MDDMFRSRLTELLAQNTLLLWNRLTAEIDTLYDVDRIWNKGFGDWALEYKYRRGGMTLCTLYAKKDVSVLLVTLGKAERDQFEIQRDAFTERLQFLFDNTKTYHDGKWLWIPIDETLSLNDVILLLRIKRRPNRKPAVVG